MSHVHVLHVSLVSKLFPSGAESAETDKCFLLVFCNCYNHTLIVSFISMSKVLFIVKWSGSRQRTSSQPNPRTELRATGCGGDGSDGGPAMRGERWGRNHQEIIRRARSRPSSQDCTCRKVSRTRIRDVVALLRKSRRPSVQHHAPRHPTDLYVPDPRLLFF